MCVYPTLNNQRLIRETQRRSSLRSHGRHDLPDRDDALGKLGVQVRHAESFEEVWVKSVLDGVVVPLAGGIKLRPVPLAGQSMVDKVDCLHDIRGFPVGVRLMF